MSKSQSAIPAEIVQQVLRWMPPEARIAFISTCKHFHREHSLDVLLVHLRELASRQPPVLLVLAPRRTLVRRRVEYAVYRRAPADATSDTDDADDALLVPGSAKYKKRIVEDWVLDPKDRPDRTLTWPFVVVAAAYTAARDDVLLDVAYNAEFEGKADTEDADCEDRTGVFLSRNFKRMVFAMQQYSGTSDSAQRQNLHEWESLYSYNEAMQTGCIFQRITTSGAMRRWLLYECWECRGKRKICPGCGRMSSRWPALFASCGFNIPCPACVGYRAALKAVRLIQAGKDQRVIDETVNVAPITVHKWSKEEWEASVNGPGAVQDASA